MSKFAVRGLADALRLELGPAGVAVTLVTPGYVESEIRRVDNTGVFREAAPESAPAFLVMPADRAARQIVRAVARRRGEVVVTAHGKVGVFLQRHAPWIIAATMRAAGLKARPEPVRR
jgi:short-subunit dehydrogenase